MESRGKPQIWSLHAPLGCLEWVESKLLSVIVARLDGALGSSLAWCLDAEFGVLAPTVCSTVPDGMGVLDRKLSLCLRDESIAQAMCLVGSLGITKPGISLLDKVARILDEVFACGVRRTSDRHSLSFIQSGRWQDAAFRSFGGRRHGGHIRLPGRW